MLITKKKVLITGVARGGIGESFAKKILAQDNQVLICSRNMTADRITGTRSLAADCTKESEIEKIQQWVLDSVENIDILINMVGGSLQSKQPLQVSQQFFEEVISVNLTSAFLLTKMAANIIQKGGSIVHLVSSSAFEPEVNKMSYSIAKAGLVQLIKTWAAILAPLDIRINGVSPTYVFTGRHLKEIQERTKTTNKPYEEIIEAITAKQLLKKPLHPDDLSEMIEFAATCPIMTGKILHATLGRIQ